jgi:hypothetical protein
MNPVQFQLKSDKNNAHFICVYSWTSSISVQIAWCLSVRYTYHWCFCLLLSIAFCKLFLSRCSYNEARNVRDESHGIMLCCPLQCSNKHLWARHPAAGRESHHLPPHYHLCVGDNSQACCAVPDRTQSPGQFQQSHRAEKYVDCSLKYFLSEL